MLSQIFDERRKDSLKLLQGGGHSADAISGRNANGATVVVVSIGMELVTPRFKIQEPRGNCNEEILRTFKNARMSNIKLANKDKDCNVLSAHGALPIMGITVIVIVNTPSLD